MASLRKRLEGGKGRKKAQQEGCCSHWCSSKQEEGKPGSQGWRMVMVRNKDLVVLRGVSAVCPGLEELEEKVTGGPCQETFNHTGRMGESRS